jgi:hypothetical protein
MVERDLMFEKEKPESKDGCVIMKELTKTSLAGGVLESQRIIVEGPDLDEIRKHFDSLWEGGS